MIPHHRLAVLIIYMPSHLHEGIISRMKRILSRTRLVILTQSHDKLGKIMIFAIVTDLDDVMEPLGNGSHVAALCILRQKDNRLGQKSAKTPRIKPQGRAFIIFYFLMSCLYSWANAN